MARRNLGKRILAIVLSVVMCVGMINLQALAASSADANQVMDGHYVLDTNNSITGTTVESTNEAHGFTVSKTIQQTGRNQFDVTLKVVTQQTVTTDASAIQLVIDRSNSMKYCASCGATDHSKCGCNAGSRMAAIKSAIAGENGFLDKLIAGNKGKLYISIVVFSGHHQDAGVKDAMTVLGWTELNASSKAAVADVVNGISYNGGTNLQAGLTLAANRLQMSDIAACSTKYTVLLTDGAPTYYMGSADNSTSEINSTAGSGSAATESTVNGGITAATAVKNQSTLYTICYGVSDEYLIEGEETNICAHCNEDRHDHHELCVNCKQERSEHTQYGKSRYCVNGYGQKYHGGYFCDAEGTTRFESSVSGELTVGQYLNGSIASSASTAYNADDMEDVYNAFSNIADSTTSGMTGFGTAVTDPMGEFIILGAVSGNGVSASGNTLTWKLDPANAEKTVSGATTTYTYQITYPITLDTAAEGFRECNDDGSVKYYPANGYTYLTAVIDNKTEKIPFNVPGVCGTIPEYNWSVEYYLQNEQGGYTLEDAQDMGAAELHSIVYAPAGYAAKYADRYYSFSAGATQMKIAASGNVMKLYYNMDMANVTVNHFYKTDIIAADGTEIPGSYPATAQLSGFETFRVGAAYTAAQQLVYGGVIYSKESATPADMEITVSADDSDNVINIYYTREDDQRAETSAQVNHTYNTYSYVLEDGKYVLKLTASVTVPAQGATGLRATTTYAVTSVSPLASYEDFALNTAKGDYAALLQSDNSLSFVLADNAEDNIRTLVFEKTVDARVPVSVIVNHYYTKSTTSVQDGQVVNTVAPNNELGKSDTYANYFVGETFTAEEVVVYNGDTYNSDAGNAAKCATMTLAGDTTIDLHYNLSVAPATVSITVNHYWRTYTTVTVEEIDPESGKVIGTTTRTDVTIDDANENNVVSNLYAGQNYTAGLLPHDGGYTFNEAASNRTISVSDGAVINLYYDRDAVADEREDARIDVLHTYTTYLQTVVAGEVTVLTLNDGVVSESFPAENEILLAGDSFTAATKPVYNENAYSVNTDAAELSVILQKGTNGTIHIDYSRRISDLVQTVYNVNYEYRTYTMTVNAEGVAGYHDAPSVAYGEAVSGNGYVGEKLTLSAGEREGFTALAGNPATVQYLQQEGNTWTFVYEKYVPLGRGSVTVNHYYTTNIIAANGVATSETQEVLGVAAPMFLGESYLAETQTGAFRLVSAMLDGNLVAAQDVSGVISGDHVVDFYYVLTVDDSILVNYSVSHIYNLYTYDGELISSQQSEAITGSAFVTTPYTAIPSPSGYNQVGSTYNGVALAAPYTVALAEGENNIVFVYELYQPREKVTVSVIHNYYEELEALSKNSPNEVYVENISGIDEDSSYTAALRNVDSYEFYSAAPESLTIVATKDGENVIVLNYIRIVEIEEEDVPQAQEPEEDRPLPPPAPADDTPVPPPPAYEPPVVEEPSVTEPPVVEEPPVEEEEELVEIPDEEVPLADVPKTGDATVFYTALTALSGVGLAALGLKKKKEDDEE